MKTTVHIIAHAHWDREWYLPLEIHRARLIDQLDNVLELLADDPSYTYHLDGQMIAVEDYLKIRPEKEDLIKKYVREGRLHIGPWYVLQDEFLTTGEANVRNLLCGMKTAGQYGPICMIGYLPDAFGNVGQMPQLFAQAGMKAAAFGRGVTLRPEAPDPENHFPAYSEFSWQSPDGSSVPAIFFSGWYNNGQEIPADPETAKVWWDERLTHARQYASSGHLLFLNGSDHQPVQKNIAEALETARKLYPDIDFVLSDFEHFADCVRESRTAAPEIVCGELAGQESDGTNTLCNTASSRVPVKELNRKNEVLLSMVTEPLLAMAAMAGMKMDNALLHRAWKLLMENHPHDSICGCGVDEVHRETVSRYEKSIQLGQFLADKAGTCLTKQIHATKLSNAEAAFAVFNTTGWSRSDVVTTEIPVEREYGGRGTRIKLEGKPFPACRLTDHTGQEIPARIEDAGIRFGYELPDDSFRKPYYERTARVTFRAENIPAFGWSTFYLKAGKQDLPIPETYDTGSHMENRWISVRIHPNGTFDLTEKTSGRTWHDLGLLEDTGDAGNEYVFSRTLDAPITDQSGEALIQCLEHNANRTVYRIGKVMLLPESADCGLDEAREAMVRHLERRVRRSLVMKEQKVTYTLTLNRDDPVLRVKVEMNNTVKDHRLRMLFPTDLAVSTHLADSVFDVVERPDIPGPNWTNPSRCQRMQYFTAAEDDKGGLAILNRGAYEYEILPERKQIAVTILRSVGEMGDWGVFPTPDAQCLGPVSMDLGIYAYPGNSFRESGFRESCQFQTDLCVFSAENTEGPLPEHGSLLKTDGSGLAVTALKPSEDEKAIIIRAVNLTEQPAEWNISVPGHDLFESSIMETKGPQLSPSGNGCAHVTAEKKQIKTLRIERR